MTSVLIADDSDSIRLVLNDILAIGNYTIAGEAVDGEDTIKKFYETKPDLLLLDLAMPKKDGLTVVKELTKTHPAVKIILITASDDQKIIQKCLDEGALAYISKPFDFDKVLKVIQENIS